METVVRIEWGSGHMDLVLDRFFPTTTKNLNVIRKAVIEAYWWKDPGQPVWPRIRSWIEDELPRCDQQARDWGERYLDAKQETADLKARIRDKKEPNGLPIGNEKLKRLRFCANELKRDAAEYKRNYESATRRRKKLEQNLRFIRGWRDDGWRGDE